MRLPFGLDNIVNRSRKILYIRIRPDALLIRDAKTGRSIEEPPFMAISGGIRVDGTNPKVLGFGKEAIALNGGQQVNVVNPFSHPRTPLSDFTVSEHIINAFIQQLVGRRNYFHLSPIIVLHLAMELDGGITQVELRALNELGKCAGAIGCFIWIGPELTDQQLVQLKFPEEGTVYDFWED